ncbi:unnamed protein product, partial [Effrenium voratum]
RRSSALEQQHAMSAAERKAAAQRLVQYVAARWEGGDKKGTLKGVTRAWSSYILESKRKGRRRQAVHAALIKSFAGEARGNLKLALLNWHATAKDERMVRQLEQMQSSSDDKWGKFLKETEDAHEAALAKAYDSVECVKMRAHHATQMVLKRWMGGDAAGTRAQMFQDWKEYVQNKLQADAQRQSVKDSVLRFIESDQRGAMHSCFLSWINYVRFEAKHQHLLDEQQKKIQGLEMQMSSMLQKKEQQMLRAAETLAGKGPALKGMVLHMWHELSIGEKRRAEEERERLVALEEMEKQREANEQLRHERIARALDGMGCRRTRVLLGEYFAAWAYLWDQSRIEQMHKLNHNEQMLQYSQFMLGQKMRNDSKALSSAVFHAWHVHRVHGRLASHELHRETLEDRLGEANGIIQQLEQQRALLQDQLQMYYQQIDLITETLQKELQTKEELASELRDAYEKLRQNAKVTMPTPTTVASDTGLSRASSVDARRKVLQDPTPKGPRTPRPVAEPMSLSGAASGGSAGGIAGGTSGALGSRAPVLPRRLREEDSPSACDWRAAVQRMNEEGLVHLDA